MAQIIKRPFRTFNGTDWDKHYFETSEDMLVGAIQSLRESGYRQFPDGYLEQWFKVIVPAKAGFVKGKFPTQFPRSCRGLSTDCIYTGAVNIFPTVSVDSLTDFTIYVRTNTAAIPSAPVHLYCRAIGY